MKKLLRLVLVLGGLLAASGALYAFAQNGKKGDGGLKLVTLETGAVTEKAIAVGQVQPRQKFSVKSKISGIVGRCYAEVGDRVKAGDPLFEINPDPTPLEVTEVDRRVESARASFERAKSDFDRATELSASGVLPRSEKDARKEAFELARIALAKAEADRDLTRKGRLEASAGHRGLESIIRAPAAGTILSRPINPGDPVVPLTSYQPGTELATVADMSDLVFRGTVDEIDVGKLKVGLPARIKVGALPDDVVTGKVARIAPQAQQKEGATLFDVEIEIDTQYRAPRSVERLAGAGGSGGSRMPPPGSELERDAKVTLRAGYSANADLVIREKKDVLVLPERLVLFEDGGKKTFVEVPESDPKKPPRKVEVAIGISDGLNVEIVKGLSKGQKVVERPPREIS